MDSRSRMNELVALLNNASLEYYQHDREILTNYEYDALYDELEKLEHETGIVLFNSPTVKVGYEVVTGLRKVAHDSPMLSLDKTKDVGKLRSFLGGRKGLLSWKLDGLTVALTYHDGQLISAVTRGNGAVGEDVTHNARAFVNLPQRIPFEREIVLRGEAVISYSDFEKINENLPPDDKYKNPRNLTSGSVRQLNSEITASRRVRFFAFALVSASGLDDSFFGYSRAKTLAWLEEQGFSIVEHALVHEDNINEAVDGFKNKTEGINFASDGLVLGFDDLSYSHSLGATAKFPKDTIAFKWADELTETNLLYVEWSTSRTGLINPVAVFTPVEIEGTTVNRASVHNLSVLEQLALGEGDVLTVYKANMIIPQIAENLTKSGTVKIPEVCSECGGKTEIVASADGKFLYCVNPNCYARLVRSLAHYVSRDAANIEGLSEATLEKFVEYGLIAEYPDIYKLIDHEFEITALEGFGERSFANLSVSIENSKKIKLHNFIFALGISQVGLANAKLLCKRFNSDINAIINAEREELIKIEGFGEVIAASVYDYFHDEHNLLLLNKALAYLEIEPPPLETTDKLIFSGKSFVITGDLNHYANRRELQELIEQNGGKVSGSVSVKTDYLVNNDTESPSQKNKKARELGVQIISEADFNTML